MSSQNSFKFKLCFDALLVLERFKVVENGLIFHHAFIHFLCGNSQVEGKVNHY